MGRSVEEKKRKEDLEKKDREIAELTASASENEGEGAKVPFFLPRKHSVKNYYTDSDSRVCSSTQEMNRRKQTGNAFEYTNRRKRKSTYPVTHLFIYSFIHSLIHSLSFSLYIGEIASGKRGGEAEIRRKDLTTRPRRPQRAAFLRLSPSSIPHRRRVFDPVERQNLLHRRPLRRILREHVLDEEQRVRGEVRPVLRDVLHRTIHRVLHQLGLRSALKGRVAHKQEEQRDTQREHIRLRGVLAVLRSIHAPRPHSNDLRRHVPRRAHDLATHQNRIPPPTWCPC